MTGNVLVFFFGRRMSSLAQVPAPPPSVQAGTELTKLDPDFSHVGDIALHTYGSFTIMHGDLLQMHLSSLLKPNFLSDRC